MFQSRPQSTLTNRLARMNWLVPALVCLLAAVGTVTLTSVAGGAFTPWAARHTLRCAAGLSLMLSFALVPLRVWMALAVPAYAAALALLAAVPLIGVEALGAKRWLTVAGLSIQPSEIMKVAIVLVLAKLYAGLSPRAVSRPHWVALALILIALPVLLTLRQPDLGTAVLFAGIGVSIMLLAGTSLWYFAALSGAALVFLPALAMRLQDYQRKRIEIFLDPASDPLGAGYHITQAKIALGNGGLSGQGYLQGSQSQLDFLPEKMTDFIFVMIGEEWGFIGTCSVLALYAALICVLFAMALRGHGMFARLLIAGVAVSLSIYVSINAAMVTGLAPVVGVPLPLVSYGGTSLITLMAGLGLALSAGLHDERLLSPGGWR